MSRVKDQLVTNHQAIWRDMEEVLRRHGVSARLRRFDVIAEPDRDARGFSAAAEGGCPPGTIEVVVCNANGCRRICREV